MNPGPKGGSTSNALIANSGMAGPGGLSPSPNAYQNLQTSEVKPLEKTFESYLFNEKKKEIDDYLKQMKFDVDNKFSSLDKDIAYLSEIQKFLSADVKDLKNDRESKFKVKEVNLEAGVNGNLDDAVKKELFNMRVQHESLFEKMQLTSDKLVAVEVQVEGLQRKEIKADPGHSLSTGSPFSEDVMHQITALQKEVGGVREELVKRDVDLNKRIDLALVNPSTSSALVKGGPIPTDVPMVNGEDPKKMREFIKRETEHIFEFIQEFVNEIAMNQISTIKSIKKGSTDKMDSLDWMARNIEFVSPKIFNNFIKTCHDIYEKNNQEKTTMYFTAHGSDVLSSLRKLILETMEPNAVNGIRKLLPNYLEALEVGLLNEYNQERAIELSLHDILITIITDETLDEAVSLRAEKSMAILLTKDNLIHKCIAKQSFVKWLALCLKRKASDIILMESRLNILSMAFKSTPVTELILKHNSSLPNQILKQLRTSKTSNAVLDANVSAIYNYSNCTSLLDYVTPPELLEILIDTANEVPVNRLKTIMYKSLNNFAKKGQYLDVIHKSGMLEVIRNANHN